LTNNIAGLLPIEVQVQTRHGWTIFASTPNCPANGHYPSNGLTPQGYVSCSLNVKYLPANTVVRLSGATPKVLLGFEGFAERLRFNLKQRRAGGSWISLNPYDKNSRVYGSQTVVVSEEWVEKAMP
jgi:hypothetical protein